MKRIGWLVATVLMMSILWVPSASATQSLNCSEQVFDNTAEQGVSEYSDVIMRHINMFKEIAPFADIYVHAYAQMPSDSQVKQCANWYDADGRMKDDVMVMIYGQDVDNVLRLYGENFRIGEDRFTPYSVAAMLGPDASQKDPAYIVQALVQPILATKTTIKLSDYYSTADGLYRPPSATHVMGSDRNELTVQERGVLIAVVIGSFLGLGLVLYLCERLFRRLYGPPTLIK